MTPDIGHPNGGPPARLATIAEILAASETQIPLPGLSATVGEPCSLKIRKLARAEFQLCLPPNPPGSDTWRTFDATTAPADVVVIKKEWAEKEAAWIETLAPEVLEARRRRIADLHFKVVSLVALDPVLTEDQARRLGDDALLVYAEILRFSGIMSDEKKSEEKREEPAVSAA